MGEMAHNNEIIHGTHRVQVRSYTDDNVVRSIDPSFPLGNPTRR